MRKNTIKRHLVEAIAIMDESGLDDGNFTALKNEYWDELRNRVWLALDELNKDEANKLGGGIIGG